MLCESPHCRIIGGVVKPRQAEGRARLCWVCIDRLYANICALPQIYDDLLVALIRSDKPDERVSGSPSGTGLALNPHAHEARHTLKAVCVSWCRMIAEERHLGLPDDTVNAIARYLAAHHDWLARHPAAGDCADEMHDLARGEPWQIAYPVGTRVRTMGKCLWTDPHNEQCTGTLYAILREPGHPQGSQLQCDTHTTHHWGTEKWPALAARAQRGQYELAAAVGC